MPETQTPQQEAGLRWYQNIPKYAWLVLIISALGWMFDTLDQQLFTLIRVRSLKDIIEHNQGLTGPALDLAVKYWSKVVTSTFLIGWAVGGFAFGILGDKLGRARTMMITILIYASFTGLNAAVYTPFQYAVCRFMTALGIGGEFAAGASLVAEVWPLRSRAMALGFLQSLSTVGNMIAALVTLAMASLDWRWVYVVGLLPALLVVWIRSSVREPEQWREARRRSKEQGGKQEFGNIAELFTDKKVSRNTYAGILISLAGVLGLWGITYFFPDMMTKLLEQSVSALTKKEGEAVIQRAKSIAFLITQIGGFIGMYGYAAFSQKAGRRMSLAAVFALAIIVVQGAYWTIHSLPAAYFWSFLLGVATLAPFSAFAVYFPELFPTRLRSTGVGFCYNCARLLAAVGIFFIGRLADKFTSNTDPIFTYRVSASIMSMIYVIGFLGIAIGPETKGKPLPE